MKIFITGALGHIGSSLIRQLPAAFPNLEIVMMDDMSTQRFCSLFDLPQNATFRFHEAKVQNVALDDFLQGVNAVVHLAALTDAAGTSDKPHLVHENNFNSTKAIAEACLRNNIPLIFPSSTSVYGSQSDLVDEDCKELQPQSPYAESKIKEEALMLEMFSRGLRGIVYRFGTIFGWSEGMRFHTAVNKFTWQAIMNQPVTVWETAIDQKRPYLALEDAVSAIIWTIKNEVYRGGIFNVATCNVTVRDILDTIRQSVPDLKITYVQHKIMNQLSYEVSSKKFLDTGFFFKGNLSRGVKETIAHMKSANEH
jgi:UDP-glucose 4-epimerase